MASAKKSARVARKVRRVIVVGGGLAGLSPTIKLCEAGIPVDLFSLVPVKRSHSVCAQGGINASVNTKGEGDSPAGPPRGDGLRRRLPRQPAARQGHDRRGAGHRLHARPHGRAVQPHARGPARLPPLRRHALPPHRVRRRDHRASSSSTRSTSRCAATRRSTSRTSTASSIPGEKMVRKWEFWDFLGLVLDDDGIARGIVAQDLKSMEIERVPRRRGVPRDGRARHHLRQLDEQRDQHRHRGERRRTSRARATRTASSSRCTRRRSPAPTSCASSRRACAARAAASGSRRTRRRSAAAATSPRSERDYFLERKYPGYGNLVPRDIAEPRALPQVLPRGRAASTTPKSGKNEIEVYLDVTHLPKELLREEARRHPRDLREVRRRRSVQEPDADLPRRPLLDGRPLGRLRDARATARSSTARRATRRRTSRGLYAVGEVDYQYHGANRLGANSLLSCIYGGMVAGPAIATYVKNLDEERVRPAERRVFEKAAKRERDAVRGDPRR